MTDQTDPKQPLKDSDLDDLLAPTEEETASLDATAPESEPSVEPEVVAAPSLEEIQAELKEVDAGINGLEEELKRILAYRMKLHGAQSKLHDADRNMPLHEMNKRQRAISEGENALRLEAEEALGTRLRNVRPRRAGDRPMTAIKRSLGRTD